MVLLKLSVCKNSGEITPAVNHAAASILEKSDNLFLCAGFSLINLLYH